MTSLSHEELYAHATRVAGRVVLITGGAIGIGRETALQFAQHGAKVVIGDINVEGAQDTVRTIQRAGGIATAFHCDVTDWDSQAKLFKRAVDIYGTVDIVVANAGVNEIPPNTVPSKEDESPVKPNIKTIQINLVGVIYTSNLAIHYLRKSSSELKALILIGSIASWQAIEGGPQYSAAKHGVLGLMRSLDMTLAQDKIRVGVINPWFADTAIVPTRVKVALAGIPLTEVPTIAGAIFCAATDPNMETSGCSWILPDNGPVIRLDKEYFKEGVYALIDARSKAIVGAISSTRLATATVRDLLRIFLRSKTSKIVALSLAGAFFWRRWPAYRDLVLSKLAV